MRKTDCVASSLFEFQAGIIGVKMKLLYKKSNELPMHKQRVIRPNAAQKNNILITNHA
jgi:hypothetical protein